ncbi:hypothetical protein NMG60_11028495 [Bertholletia excelsa]
MSDFTSPSSSTSAFDASQDSDKGADRNLDNCTIKSSQDSPSQTRPEVLKLPEPPPQYGEWSMMSISPRGGPENSYQWSIIAASPKQSPPIQTMCWPETGYDPNRIPSSIFASKPSTTMEWSVASNESLFSLHMGKNSFRRDSSVLLSRYEEPVKPDESSNFTSETKFNGLAPTLPTVVEGASDSIINESATVSVAAKETEEDQRQESTPLVVGARLSTSSTVSGARASTTASCSRRSGESGTSGCCFAFPVQVLLLCSEFCC